MQIARVPVIYANSSTGSVSAPLPNEAVVLFDSNAYVDLSVCLSAPAPGPSPRYPSQR